MLYWKLDADAYKDDYQKDPKLMAIRKARNYSYTVRVYVCICVCVYIGKCASMCMCVHVCCVFMLMSVGACVGSCVYLLVHALKASSAPF